PGGFGGQTPGRSGQRADIHPEGGHISVPAPADENGGCNLLPSGLYRRLRIRTGSCRLKRLVGSSGGCASIATGRELPYTSSPCPEGCHSLCGCAFSIARLSVPIKPRGWGRSARGRKRIDRPPA